MKVSLKQSLWLATIYQPYLSLSTVNVGGKCLKNASNNLITHFCSFIYPKCIYTTESRWGVCRVHQVNKLKCLKFVRPDPIEGSPTLQLFANIAVFNYNHSFIHTTINIHHSLSKGQKYFKVHVCTAYEFFRPSSTAQYMIM